MIPLSGYVDVANGPWTPLALQWRRADSSLLSGITDSVGHGRAWLKELASLA